jgi:hypothetical protein
MSGLFGHPAGVVLLSGLLLPVSARAQQTNAAAQHDGSPQTAQQPGGGEGESGEQLAKAAQNPISSLISVPFQLNFNGDIGPFRRTLTVFNLQPVIPLALGEKVTLVTRWIMPFVGVPDAAKPTGTAWGFGDFNPQWYLALHLPAGFMIGPGVTVVVPTASDARLGAGKWQLGPAFVLVWNGGPLLAGFLFYNAFSVGGDNQRPAVSTFFVQPFLNVNLPKGTYLVYAPQITNDWKKNDAWIVPLGFGVGQILALGAQPVNFSVQGYANVISPKLGPDWTIRVQMQLLFPVKKKS